MSFWILYIIAIIPLAIGGIFWYLNPKQFTWQEWVGNTALVFVIAAVFHAVAIHNGTSDTETWSGQVRKVKYIPAWVESYRIKHTVHHSSGSGKTRVTWTTHYYTHHTANHPESWWCHTDLPNLSLEISKDQYSQFKKELGDTVVVIDGDRRTGRDSSKMKSGDPKDYDTPNTSRAVIPVTNCYGFENRVKAASSLFSFPRVPEDAGLPDYPLNDDHFRSDRLIGSAVLVDAKAFDQMNTRLGFKKHANVILVGMNKDSEMRGRLLEAKWVGGKKNDVVIAYGGPNKKPDWVYAFSWTDKKTVLRILEEVVLRDGVSTDVLPTLEKEINEHYTAKNWKDFDYISIPVRMGFVWGFLILTLVSQCFLMWWYHTNGIREYAMSPIRNFRSRTFHY